MKLLQITAWLSTGMRTTELGSLCIVRPCRRTALEEELAREGLTPEERQSILDEHAKRESDYTRLQRQRMSSADFENLTIIGRGAFGEVRTSHEFQLLMAVRIDVALTMRGAKSDVHNALVSLRNPAKLRMLPISIPLSHIHTPVSGADSPREG